MINFEDNQLQPYGNKQNQDIVSSIFDRGRTLRLSGDGWKKIALPYTITANTILEFEFKSHAMGGIHSIGFDRDNGLSPTQSFQLYGSQSWGIDRFNTYQSSAGDWKTYRISVGDFFTGNTSFLTFGNNHDVVNPSAESFFRHINLYEATASASGSNTKNSRVDRKNDRVIGRGGDDSLNGGNGQDTLYGRAGNDSLQGGNGHDRLYGHQGRDEIEGGAGKDTLVGGSGEDTLMGGSGRDHLKGNQGHDHLYGGADNDVIFAGLGRDRLYGGDGDDRLYGHLDDDLIHGNEGNDKLWGGQGNDELYGQDGHDSLVGAVGHDLLVGGDGNDTLRGNQGNDLIYGHERDSGLDEIGQLSDDVAGNAIVDQAAIAPNTAGLIFRSGFESGTNPVLRHGRVVDIRGIDRSVDSAGNWDSDLQNFWINYVDYDKGGPNPDFLGSNIVSDPEGGRNQVFHTWQKDAEKQDNGPYSRVQGELNNLDWPEAYYKVRFRLGSDIASVNSHSESDAGLSLVEFVTGNGKHRKLIRIILHKWGDNKSFSDGTAPLQWRAEVLNWNETGGHELFKGSHVEPAYDRWQTLEFYVKSGDANTGKFWVRLNESQVLFDETVETKAPGATLDIERSSFLKSYGGNLVKEVKQNGGQVDVWYDDLEIWNRLPDHVAQSIEEPKTNLELSINANDAEVQQHETIGKSVTNRLGDKTVPVGPVSHDVLIGGTGDDTLIAGIGNDTLRGNLDDDKLYSHGGDDLLDGGNGHDYLEAGHGNDTLLGGLGDDDLVAGTGADILVGGEGNDTLDGGNGRDLFVFAGTFGRDVVVNFEQGIDQIDLQPLHTGIRTLDSNNDQVIDSRDLNVKRVGNALRISFPSNNGNEIILQGVEYIATADVNL